MTLKKNQDKRGTQKGTSTNPTARTGRDSFLKPNQSKRGTQHGTSGPEGRSTRPVPKETQSGIGTKAIRGGDGAGSVKRLPDDISSAGGGY